MAAGSLWEDPEFPADDTSISWEMFGYGSMGNSNSDGVAESLPMGMPWKRPSEMGQGLSANPSLMGDLGKPMPQGINQGGVLADCWFMASMSAIAEQPDRILNNMYNRYYNSAGAFRFYFFAIDSWVGINIDDRLPVTSWGSGWRPKAAWPSKHNAWWMPLFEKAYAKFLQNYDRLGWGRGSEALRTMTAKPTLSLSHKGVSSAELWKRHSLWAKKDFPQVVSCCNNVPGGLDGLTSGHAYSLLDVRTLNWSDGSVAYRIAKLRNPWNSERYVGKWSDNDPGWTADFKAQVGLSAADDGIFWMPYENY